MENVLFIFLVEMCEPENATLLNYNLSYFLFASGAITITVNFYVLGFLKHTKTDTQEVPKAGLLN